MDRDDLMWLAGLLEGEGCFSVNGRTPAIQVSMVDEDVIKKAADVVGVTAHHRPKSGMWGCGLYGDAAIELMEDLRPYMGKRRSERIDMCVERRRLFPSRARGEDRIQAKLKVAWVPLIRELARRGVSQGCIAETCGVAQATISDVVIGKTWSHIDA